MQLQRDIIKILQFPINKFSGEEAFFISDCKPYGRVPHVAEANKPAANIH